MPKSLLLVDDSVTIQKAVQMTFRAEDVTLTVVSDGNEALARAKAMKPDLILLDIGMPGAGGYELCEKVRGDAAVRHIPVLLLGGGTPVDPSKAIAVGANGQMPKPFDSQKLIDQVKQILANPRAIPAGGAAAGPRPSAPPTATGAPGQVRAAAAPPSRPPSPAARPPQPGAPAPTAVMARPQAAPGTRPAPPQGRPPGPAPAGLRPAGSSPPRPPGSMPPAARPAQPPAGRAPVPPGSRPPPNPAAARPPAARPSAPPGRPPPAIPTPQPTLRHAAPVPPPDDAPMEVDEIVEDTGPAPAAPRRPIPAASRQAPLAVVSDGGGARGDGGEALLREALSKASRDVIEKIAWEVVPELAETIIREELERLMKERGG